MNPLPDMVIIDFCEWLSNILPVRHTDLDLYDLILDEENHYLLEEYAREFLFFQKYQSTVKSLFHRFIDSEEFDQRLKETQQFIQSHQKPFIRPYHFIHDIQLDELFECFINRTHCAEWEWLEQSWHELNDRDLGFSMRNQKVTPRILARSVCHLFWEYRSEPLSCDDHSRLFHLMNHVQLNIDIEVDFLVWLVQSNGEPIDLQKMPLRTFELLAKKFQDECGKSDREKQKLIKSFKQTSMWILSEKLAALLPLNVAKRAKDLGYIFKRYNDKNIPFKCFIVPLQADSAEYIDLIENRWYDLHYLSGDYLDIYYSKADYGRSGFEITQKMRYIPESLKTKAPLIVLWNDDLTKACGIDISRLDNTAIFEVIRYIVNLIREGKNLTTIVQEANQMCKKLREEQRPVTYTTTNTVTIKDNATVIGPVAGENSGNMVFRSEERTSEADVLHELEAAKRIIFKFSEINDRQKQLLAEIIDEAKNAIKDDSADKKVESKKHFKDAVDLIGVGSKLISALSGLTNVLRFFGISPE